MIGYEYATDSYPFGYLGRCKYSVVLIWDLEIRSKTSRKAVTKLGGVLDTVILTNAPPLK